MQRLKVGDDLLQEIEVDGGETASVDSGTCTSYAEFESFIAADGPGSMPPRRSLRPSGSVTSSVPRRNLDPNLNASRTRRGRSESTASTLAGVTEMRSDMGRSVDCGSGSSLS